MTGFDFRILTARTQKADDRIRPQLAALGIGLSQLSDAVEAACRPARSLGDALLELERTVVWRGRLRHARRHRRGGSRG